MSSDASISPDDRAPDSASEEQGEEERADSEPREQQGWDEVASTGHPGVDEVLQSLTATHGQDATEHVAIFEEAHTRLRSILNQAGDDTRAVSPPAAP